MPGRQTDTTQQHRILVVDDEPGIQKTLCAYLESDGYLVKTVASGSDAVSAARLFVPDVVILDVMLPGIDGIEVLRLLRQESEVLVLMLSARGEEADRLVGLRMGADDYVVKPFSPREVVARVAALLRRNRGASGAPDSTIRFERVTIDPAARKAWKDGALLNLTPIEFELLSALAGNHDRVLSREQLIERAWGHDYFIDERVVDVHIRRLRTKIEDDPANSQIITTVRSIGYRFEAAKA